MRPGDTNLTHTAEPASVVNGILNVSPGRQLLPTFLTSASRRVFATDDISSPDSVDNAGVPLG
jgi:hypothetical protein